MFFDLNLNASRDMKNEEEDDENLTRANDTLRTLQQHFVKD